MDGVVPLAAVPAPAAGGKAAVLGELARAGFPVPAGFVVPLGTYRAAAAALDLPGLLAARGPAAVGELLRTRPLPPVLLAGLAAAEEVRRDAAEAVRRSATGEDGALASAAGQHDTTLGVRGVAAVAGAVRATWASL
ncbi:PEP/pyruvate-binding domain-containing protein, partial [Kineococcus glutinatus]|uniref:PEP/pyruvate-binding domain-containing protein n=1 Tax=Kineococcus glutinatus TaxID=1070872 RepID=UPI0031E969FE